MLDALPALLKKLDPWLAKIQWLPPLLARITVGLVFLETGWGKLHDLQKVIDYFTELGIPAPGLQAPFVAGVEFVCGLLVLVGLATRLASIPLIGTMTVAIITARREDIGELTDLFGFEEFLYICLLTWLVVYGAGKISADGWLCSGKKKKR
jgi:putative oxidoreductase